MKITVNRKALLAVLMTGKKIVGARNTLPILANTHLKVQCGLRITVTNLDTTYTDWITDIGTTGVDQWSTTVSLHQLYTLLKNADVETVTLNLKNKMLVIVCGKQTTKLVTLPVEEFPNLPAVPDSCVVFDAQTVVDLAERTWCVSTKLARPSLCGVHLTFSESGIEACATNEHVLSVLHIPCESWKDLPGTEVLISREALELAARLSKAEIRRAKKQKREPGTIGFGFSDTLVGFHLGEKKIIARALEGPYPPYQKVIPKNNTQTIVFDHSELTDILKQLAPFTPKPTHQVGIVMKKRVATLTVSVPDSAKIVQKLPCRNSGGVFTVSYNAYYLLNCLKHLFKSDNVTFSVSSPVKATILKTDDSDDLALLMALKSGK